MLLPLFGAGTVFLLIAVVAALFGFGAISDETPLAGKVFAVFFLLLAMASFSWGYLNRTRPVV